MDPIITVALALLIFMAFWRLRRTFRGARNGKQAEEIQRKLAELRKKRDEE